MALDTQESGWKKAGEGSVKKGTCRRGLEKGGLRPLGTASGRAPRDGAGSRHGCAAWEACDTESCAASWGQSRTAPGTSPQRLTARPEFTGFILPRRAGQPGVQIWAAPGGDTGGRGALRWGPSHFPGGQTRCFRDLVQKEGVKGLRPAEVERAFVPRRGKGVQRRRSLAGRLTWGAGPGTSRAPRTGVRVCGWLCTYTHARTPARGAVDGEADRSPAARRGPKGVCRSPQAALKEHRGARVCAGGSTPSPSAPGPQSAC